MFRYFFKLNLLFFTATFVLSCANIPFLGSDKHTKSLGIILGPGGPKSFAHAGFLKSLDDNQISIKAIVGLEWSSLIAALYAENKQAHSMEWKLYKLNNQKLGKNFWKNRAKNSNFLRGYLKENFKRKNISSFAIPFSCPQFNIQTGESQIISSGRASSLLESCITYPPFLKTGRAWVSGVLEIQKVVDFLKSQGAETIVFVDVLGKKRIFSAQEASRNLGSAILWKAVQVQIQEQKQIFDHYVEVKTSSRFLDWTKQKNLFNDGKRAGEIWSEIFSKSYGL